MTTPRNRAIVSLTVALGTALALGACVQPQPYTALDVPVPLQEASVHTVRFDNTANEHAHIYLVTNERQWLLGRVEPGGRVTLRVPDAAIVAANAGHAQLAVLTGERITPQVTRNPRATLTIAQPASALLSHRWTLMQGQVTPVGLRGAPGPVRP